MPKLSYSWAVALGLVVIAGLVIPARGYIAVSAVRLTLSEVALEFPAIAVFRIERIDADRGTCLLTRTQILQGTPPASVKHSLTLDGRMPERLKPLKVGDTLVAFMGSPDKRSLTLSPCGWYLTVPDHDWERLTSFRDDFDCLFAGSPADLAAAIRTLALGGDVVAPIAIKDSRGPKAFIKYAADFPHRRFPARDPAAKDRPLATILAAARSEDIATRQQALVELAERFAANPAAAPVFLKALTDKHPEVRTAAAFGLSQAKSPSVETIAALAKALSDEDRFFCAFSAYALGTIGPATEPALKPLAEAFKDRSYDFDYRPLRAAEAAEAVLKIDPAGEQGPAALQFLLSGKMLNDQRSDSEGTRAAAARALGRCAKGAAGALPDLAKCLKDPVAATRIAAAEAILLIGGSEPQRQAAGAVLKAALQSPDPAVKIQAIRALGRTKQKDARSDLTAMESDPLPEVRQAATQALQAIP